MKIVQSLWTKKVHKQTPHNYSTIHSCGWPSKKYNYLAWALSALQYRKFYDQVELVTDKIGYDLLINKLELPYTSVKVVLDDVSLHHEDLMMLGKVYAYSIQQEPFLHVDADTFIWQKFDDELMNGDLICQSPEKGTFYNKLYGDVYFSMLRHFQYCPQILEESIQRNNSIQAINAGIIGGRDYAFFTEYAKVVFDFVERNIDYLHKIDVVSANIIFEQFVFSSQAEAKQKNIRFLGSQEGRFLTDIVDLTGVPGRTPYVHLYAGHKKGGYFVNAMEHRMIKDHPQHYFRIMKLLKTNQI